MNYAINYSISLSQLQDEAQHIPLLCFQIPTLLLKTKAPFISFSRPLYCIMFHFQKLPLSTDILASYT